MPKVRIEHAHSLPLPEVKKRLQMLADKLSEKYGIEAKWVSDHEADVKRTGVTGKITTTADKVTVALDLSFVLSPLKEKIETRVKEQLQKSLSEPMPS
jgi:putative polyhydroxyalkanoate system protein